MPAIFSEQCKWQELWLIIDFQTCVYLRALCALACTCVLLACTCILLEYQEAVQVCNALILDNSGTFPISIVLCFLRGCKLLLSFFYFVLQPTVYKQDPMYRIYPSVCLQYSRSAPATALPPGHVWQKCCRHLYRIAITAEVRSQQLHRLDGTRLVPKTPILTHSFCEGCMVRNRYCSISFNSYIPCPKPSKFVRNVPHSTLLVQNHLTGCQPLVSCFSCSKCCFLQC